MASVVMVAIECTCLAFLMVIMAAYIILPRQGSLNKDGFFLCLLSLILGITFDMISWACECAPSPQWLQYGSNTLCLAVSGFINAFFAYYIVGIVREKKPVSWVFARVIAIVNLCGTVIVTAAALCGKLFEIVPYPDNPDVMLYEAAGIFYDVPNYLSAVSLIALFVFVLCNAKVLGKNQIIVFSIYFLLPMLSSGLELLSESLQYSYAVTGVCMCIVYVMLQSNRMNEMELREKLLNEWSYVDTLTGLLNRRAFDRTMEEASGDDSVSIAFCDLNGLKKVNDENGHVAGDQYLIKFSNMLVKHFSHDCVYRISGDEFVVILRKTGMDGFENRIKGLREDIDANSSIAALGCASGRGADISKVLNEAETGMYDDKEIYYKNNPGCRRRTAEA